MADERDDRSGDLRRDQAPDRGADVGKTSGGGSLGHDQPKDVAEQTPIRNTPRSRGDEDADRQGRRDDAPARDPVMPSNDETLNTKI
jgi:hypothetical protein